MKISVVISIKDRTKLFRRSLKLYQKQTMPKSDWELIIVDDMSTENVFETLQEHSSKINWQYIKMNSNLNDFPIYWGPSLSNNIGFKAAKGEVIVITGPEMLMQEQAFKYAYESAMKGVNAYGHILHSSHIFVQLMDKNPAMENYSFDRLFSLPQAKVQDITKNTFYWFFSAVKKEFLMKINGCDEELMRGICADDDLIRYRLCDVGAKNIHDFRIIGIHQDHSLADRKDPKRIRWNPTWEKARLRNTKYYEDWLKTPNRDPIANKNRDWGSDKLIINKVTHEV